MEYKKYQEKFVKLKSKLQTLEEFRQDDSMVDFVFKVAKSFFDKEDATQDGDWLMKKGSKLTGAFAYLEVRANEFRAQSELAEIANKSVKNSIMLSLREGDMMVTDARATSQERTMSADVDVIALKQKADNYKTAARTASTIIMFIQSILKSQQKEYSQGNIT